MEINEKHVDAWIAYWKEYVGNYDLPSWDMIPDFGLYMEQVVTFIRNTLSYMERDPDDDPVITASAINNYVRKKYMPQPVKKRYYRSHIAYLIVLCALKHSLSISEIQKILPMDIQEEELRQFYTEFTKQHKRASEYFIKRIESAKRLIMSDSNLESIFRNNATELVIDVSLISSFAKMLSERLLSSSGDLPIPDDN